ncbi:protein-tyrosine phosphatase Siw14 family protein [Sporobolomyces salmoneus]|uniref:protein-tyrosine phosphatase Siw14 family protein n=1 Tax=Sporobolomyces salmoneus TaxID=183962 RepID=UPI0031719AA4
MSSRRIDRDETERLVNSSNSDSVTPVSSATERPPEWMLRIMQERGRGDSGGTSIGMRMKLDLGEESGSCELGHQPETMMEDGMSQGERGDTPRVSCSQDEKGPRGAGQGEGREGEVTRQLLGEALSSVDIPTPQPNESCPIDATEGEASQCVVQPSPSPHHEFSSASSNSSHASTSTRYGGGGYTTAGSSSSASSSGFSSRASGSSITSDSSVTTFSVSSHERDREKEKTYHHSKEYDLGRGRGRGRSYSAEPFEFNQGESGGGPSSIASIASQGPGLYQSLTASPTFSSPPHDFNPSPQHRFSDHSPLTLSPNPSRSTSFDLLSPSTSKATEAGGGGRDSTILPSHPTRTHLPFAPRSSSPTPSTSTLTIDTPAFSSPPAPPLPHPPSTLSHYVSPPRSPSLKGKEKALPHPLPLPSPPRSTLTLTTTTTLSEAGSSEEEEDERTLYPPENFAIVVPGIFRSSFPRKKNFGFLKSLGLKSVLTLIQDEYPQENLDFLEQEGIQLFQFPIPGNKEPFVHIPDDKIVAAMAVLLDTRNHPLLIHCNKGKHRTGCLVGVLRRLQTWSLTAIFDEYRRYSHPKSRQMDLQFIEAFKGLDLIWDLASQNRPHLPSWACTTPYSTPQRGKVPTEAKTKERNSSRAPTRPSSIKDVEATTRLIEAEEEKEGGEGAKGGEGKVS